MSLREMLSEPFRNIKYNLSIKRMCPKCVSGDLTKIPHKDWREYWFSTPTFHCEKCGWTGNHPVITSLETYEAIYREAKQE